MPLLRLLGRIAVHAPCEYTPAPTCSNDEEYSVVSTCKMLMLQISLARRSSVKACENRTSARENYLRLICNASRLQEISHEKDLFNIAIYLDSFLFRSICWQHKKKSDFIGVQISCPIATWFMTPKLKKILSGHTSQGVYLSFSLGQHGQFFLVAKYSLQRQGDEPAKTQCIFQV